MRKTVELDESESAVCQTHAWTELKRTLTTEHSTLAIDETDHSYTITCSAGLADGVLERIQNFLKENAIREEFVVASSVGMAAVVKRYLNDEIAAVCNDFVACRVSVDAVFDDASKGSGFVVRGTVHGLKNAVKRIDVLLRKVVEREKTIDRPGIPQYLQSSRGRQEIGSIGAKRRAYIGEVVDDFVGEKPVPVSSAAGPTVKLTVSVGKKLITKVVVGDITEYKVDAVVNAANGSLDHAGGLARSIVDKGMTTYQLYLDKPFLCILVCCSSAFSALTLLVGQQEGHLACKTEWWGYWRSGVVICLERGADLHMAQLMPLPLTVSCSSKI